MKNIKKKFILLVFHRFKTPAGQLTINHWSPPQRGTPCVAAESRISVGQPASAHCLSLCVRVCVRACVRASECICVVRVRVCVCVMSKQQRWLKMPATRLYFLRAGTIRGSLSSMRSRDRTHEYIPPSSSLSPVGLARSLPAFAISRCLPSPRSPAQF